MAAWVDIYYCSSYIASLFYYMQPSTDKTGGPILIDNFPKSVHAAAIATFICTWLHVIQQLRSYSSISPPMQLNTRMIKSNFYGDRFWQNYILPKSVPHKSHFYSCTCMAAWMHVAIKLASYMYLLLKYRIAGKFGGGKVWRIWRITRRSPNLNHPNFLIIISYAMLL